jgi:hypothetical protein
MDVNVGDGVVAALKRVSTEKLQVVLHTVLQYQTPLMDALGITITEELDFRSGRDRQPRFILPALKPSECHLGASEALGVSEFCDEQTSGLFTALAQALLAQAENAQIPDGPPN